MVRCESSQGPPTNKYMSLGGSEWEVTADNGRKKGHRGKGTGKEEKAGVTSQPSRQVLGRLRLSSLLTTGPGYDSELPTSAESRTTQC